MTEPQVSAGVPLEEEVDYYFERGLMVFTSAFHLRRGYCCRSGCRHCPYGFTSSAEDAAPPAKE